MSNQWCGRCILKGESDDVWLMDGMEGLYAFSLYGIGVVIYGWWVSNLKRKCMFGVGHGKLMLLEGEDEYMGILLLSA